MKVRRAGRGGREGRSPGGWGAGAGAAGLSLEGRHHREADRVRERGEVLRQEAGGGRAHAPVDGVREAVQERGERRGLPGTKVG